MNPIRVLIVDDNRQAKRAIRMILNSDEQFEIVGEASDGQEAVSRCENVRPSLVLMDINMPVMNGLEATRLIKQSLPQTTVVVLSVSDDAADLLDAFRCGAQGYLVKRLHSADWTPYLKNIVDGEVPISRQMAAKILSEFKVAEPVSTPNAALGSLTSRESEILEFVRIGATNREIAAKLFIAENTVKNHLKNIMAKLQVQNRVQLASLTNRRDGSQSGWSGTSNWMRK